MDSTLQESEILAKEPKEKSEEKREKEKVDEMSPGMVEEESNGGEIMQPSMEILSEKEEESKEKRKSEEPKLRYIALYTISQLLRMETKEYLYAFDPESIKEVLSQALIYSDPITCNALFACLIGMLNELPDDTKTFFQNIDQSMISNAILNIPVEANIHNFGLIFLKQLL